MAIKLRKMDVSVSVIIPTMAIAAHARLLLRAIESLQQSVHVGAPIIVVNGSRFDAPLVEHLKALRGIRLFYREEGSQARALLFGRSVVETPYFSTLDDDDEYLPGAIDIRLSPFLHDPNIDVVVTNGYARRGDAETIDYPKFAELSAAPLEALMRCNWLQPVNALFRSETITPSYFEGMPDHLEWTYLALQFAMTRKIHFVDTPTYRMNRDTPEAMSTSWTYLLGQPNALQRLLQLNPPPKVRRILRDRLSASLHEISDRYRREGDTGRAWTYHLKTVLSSGGYRYVAYTRHLLLRS
jgi:glycosyltransferase involved in cell wall biosynthesis